MNAIGKPIMMWKGGDTLTKKTLTVYSMLFLCAFTFALSFSLARAEGGGPGGCPCYCCVEYCPGYPTTVSVEGHWEKINPLGDCNVNNLFCSGQADRCSFDCKFHFTYLCP